MSDIPELSVSGEKRVVDILFLAGFALSKREAERLIVGGGVRIDGIPVLDTRASWDTKAMHVLSVGPRRHARILP